jgi:glycosyltransferase involved in cell wall biosynthesis
MSGTRILQVAHDHPDWTPGGSEIVAHDLARALDAREDTVARLLVASTTLQRPGVAGGALGAHGEDYVIQTGAYDRFSMARLDGPAWIEALARVLEATGPDIVHMHGLDRIGAEVVSAVRRLAPQCRIVLTLHDYQLVCPNDGLLLTTVEGARCMGATPDGCRRCFPEQSAARHALRRAHLMALLAGVDRFIAPSAFLRDRFVAWGLEETRIELVPNAVAGAVAEPEAQMRERTRRARFAFFGNIARHKGALVLLDAATLLKRSGDDVRVTLHGGLGWTDDTFRREFEVKLRRAQPIAAHLGSYRREEVLRLMRQADWIVVPSIWWENAPLVIHEARAAGRPVICSGVGGMAELVADGVTGLHVPPGNAAALAETMRDAADPELWARLSAGVAPAPYSAFVDAHVRIYQSLLDRVPA